MVAWSPKHLKKRVTRAYHRIGGSDVVRRHDIAVRFAKKHGLVYFHTVTTDTDDAPVIRGSTATHDQIDSNFCIGTHSGYDMALIERSADIAYRNFDTSFHRWYVLEIDLKHAHGLPFTFIGTKQQTKAHYARVLTSHRGVAHVHMPSYDSAHPFNAHYAVIAPPNELPRIQTLLDTPTIDRMSSHAYPFAVEIEDDTMIVITDAQKPSEQLLDKLLHYGLWLAKHIDETMN